MRGYSELETAHSGHEVILVMEYWELVRARGHHEIMSSHVAGVNRGFMA